MNESISKSIERGMALSLSGSTPVTEMSKYVLENALGRKVTMDGYATPAQVLRHLEEVKDEAAAKAAASKAEHQQHHFEFSQALDSVGLGTVFHPEELRFDNPEVSLHRGPNDDTLTHRYHEGTHQVALARRTGAGNRIGYGSHQNPRDALMMAIKDFNGKRAKGVNEDYEFDKSGKYITEASKSPNAVRMTSSVRQHLGGGMIAQTRNGKYYLLDPHATNGKLPRPGEEIDPSKHHYIGDGEWTPKHADTVRMINMQKDESRVDEDESLDELSKEVLLRYIHKSLPDAVGRSHMAGRDAAEGNRSATLASYAGMDKARSRMSGVETAAKKLARKPADEQIESRVNEADHSDFVKALKDSGMDSHFRDSNIQSLTNPGTHDFYGKSGELLSHERDPQTGNHLVMLSKRTPGGMRRAFGSGADAASALRDVMRKYGDSIAESELLHELSKDTLASYIRKASVDARHREFRAGRNAVLGIARNNDYSESDKDLVKSLARQRGITKAAEKLAASKNESLDELSKDTLASYIRRASIDAANASYVAGRDAQFGGDDHGASARRGIARSIKRTTGIKKAAEKLAASPKNESESLNELSKDTLLRYIRKSMRDAGNREVKAGRAYERFANNSSDSDSRKEFRAHELKSAMRQNGIALAARKLARGSVNEAAPPDMEDWVKANKARFIKEYGDKKGHEVLYATAWKLHDKKANEDTLAESGTIEVIPHRVGITKDGKIVSPFSAGIDHIEKTGKWTWGVTDHNGNYTTGMSRTPVDSRAEAEKIAHGVSAKTGYKVKVNESTLDELHPETAKRYMHKAIRTAIQGKYDNDDAKRDKRFLGISRAAKRVRGDFHPGQDNSDGAVSESEQDNIDHVKRMKAYHAAVKATDDASMAKVHFRMRHDISQPDNREAYNQLKRKHREARRAEAAAAEHVKGVLFAKHVLGENELNELSPATIRSYLTKAIRDYGASRDTMGYMAGEGKGGPLKDKTARNAKKRMVGIQRAIDNFGDDTQRNIKLPDGFGESVLEAKDYSKARKELADLLDRDFHTLRSSEVARVVDQADAAHYRKPKDANGSRGRYFHELLRRSASKADEAFVLDGAVSPLFSNK